MKRYMFVERLRSSDGVQSGSLIPTSFREYLDDSMAGRSRRGQRLFGRFF
jgi:hypothetical protein